jgi:hypothetical protein
MMLGFISTKEITEKLTAMEKDPQMLTASTYSPLAVDYPDNRLPFVTFHLQYLQSHKNVNPEHYLSNLRLKITKR